jgi:apolipoprotein N-acyltransferase
MSSPSLAEAAPEPNDAGGTRVRSGPHPVTLAVGSALVLWTAFPPADWSWLAWVALVPLFLLVPSRRPALSLYLGAWAGGMVFWSLAIQWVRLTDPSAWLGWLVMALALSVFWPAFLALTRLAVHRLRLPLMIAAPVVWVALEYVRAYFATGFPWFYLAHSQHAVLPVIQLADLTGSLGVSAVVALVNAWLVDVLTLPLLRPTPLGARLTRVQSLRLAAVATVLAATLGYGAFRLGTARFRDGPRVALIQSSFVQRLKESKRLDDLVAAYRALIDRAARAVKRPDLIVWPETSYPYGYVAIEPGLDDDTLDRQAKTLSKTLTAAQRRLQRDRIAADLHAWTDLVGIPMLVGSVTYDHRRDGLSRYNSAILFQPGLATIQCFHKLHLVPFGEYVPLIKVLPWLTVLTPYHGTHVPSLNPGRDPVWLELGPYRLAAAICFEDTVPQAVRRFFRESKDGRHPDVLINMSNDGWFQGSSEHEMHLAVSVFRAVENRVPLARAANTGVSAIVDGNGRVVVSLPTLKEGVLVGLIPLDDRAGLYSHWGDWLGLSCLAVSIGLLPLAWVWPARRRRTTR